MTKKLELKTLAGKTISPLGLGNNAQMDSDCVKVAFEAGINYFFFYNFTYTNLLEGLKQLLLFQRERVIVATGSSDRSVKRLRQYIHQVHQQLNINIVDIFFAEYISPSDNIKQVYTVLEELHDWKEKGLIRYVGVTTHNRPLALKLLQSGQCEVLMHRYNMAHRKAEEDVLPTALKAGIPVIAFTCTRWSSLLKGHPNWQGEIPTAADCYRFALHHRAICLALTAPKNQSELEQNLQVLHSPQLTSAEIVPWQQYGDLIYGDGKDNFETQWL